MKDCTPSCLMGCDLPLSDRSNPDFHTFCLNPNSRAVKAAFRACDNPLQISRKRIYGAALEQQSPACQGTGNEDRRTRKLSTPARARHPDEDDGEQVEPDYPVLLQERRVGGLQPLLPFGLIAVLSFMQPQPEGPSILACA